MEKETRSSTMVDKISPGSDVIAHESPSTLSMVLPSTSFMKVGEGPKADEKFEVSPISGPNNNAATFAITTVTGFGSDKPALPNGSISNPSLFNLENKIISSAEISTSVTSSKETAKSALVFGLEKAVPSKEGGPDAPPVNFDTNQNVFKVPPIPFTTSSIVGGESSLKFGASFDSQSGGSISFTTVAGSTGSMQKVRETDGGDAETNTNTGFSVRTAELAVSSAAPASLSTPPNSPSFSSSFPSPVSSNFSNSSSSLSAIGGISATTASTGVRKRQRLEKSSGTSTVPAIANGPTTVSSGITNSAPSSTVNVDRISPSDGGNVTVGKDFPSDSSDKGVKVVAERESMPSISDGLGTRPSSSSAVCFSSSDPVLVPSNDSRFPGAVGAIKREVGGQRPPTELNVANTSENKSSASETGSSFQGKNQRKSPAVAKNHVPEVPSSSTVIHGTTSVSRPSSNNNNRSQQISGLRKADSIKEWKPKPTHSINQVSGPASVSESSVVSAEATIQLPSVSKVLDSEEAASELQKKLENLHVPPRQHVILPNHILVPDRWMESRPWEGQNTKDEKYHPVAGTVFNQLMNFNTLHHYMTDLARKYKTYRLLSPCRMQQNLQILCLKLQCPILS
ncbi:cell wall protein AWA1 [Lathyrus oleraceus]|uniref:cell wall protein AWA1 n=1 Tax=Pisum sativum TaxID=3888 RepID=UPI0021D3CE98|nr:cell wall protein AWA1-like [Pisum sativum]